MPDCGVVGFCRTFSTYSSWFLALLIWELRRKLFISYLGDVGCYYFMGAVITVGLAAALAVALAAAVVLPGGLCYFLGPTRRSNHFLCYFPVDCYVETEGLHFALLYRSIL